MRIGIDLGGTHIAVAVVSERNTIIGKREMDIAKSEFIEDMKLYIIDNIKILIGEVLRDVGAPSCVVSKIGIAIPGRVKDNVAYDIYNLGIEEFELAKILEDHYGIEVSLRNDAKCAALAENQIGNLKEYDDAVFLCLGTGIGGATFINGKMLEYNKEWGSEYGHMVVEKNGIECKCGNKGCWEKYASMKAFKNGLIEMLNLDPEITSQEIYKLLMDKIAVDDPQINDYIDNYIENILIGISNISNILQPEAICIGGSFAYFEKILYSRLIEKMNIKDYNGNKPKVILAKLENDAGIIGALM